MPSFVIEGSSSDGYRLWFTDSDGNLNTLGEPFEFEWQAKAWAANNGFKVAE